MMGIGPGSHGSCVTLPCEHALLHCGRAGKDGAPVQGRAADLGEDPAAAGVGGGDVSASWSLAAGAASYRAPHIARILAGLPPHLAGAFRAGRPWTLASAWAPDLCFDLATIPALWRACTMSSAKGCLEGATCGFATV